MLLWSSEVLGFADMGGWGSTILPDFQENITEEKNGLHHFTLQ